MKKRIMGIAVFAIILSGCNNNDSTENKKSSDTTVNNSEAKNTATDAGAKGTASIKEIVDHYIEMKNALADDNGKEAATHGKAMMDAFDKMDKTSLTAGQKKVYDDASNDARENAEHISTNADKIEHQREHFDMLSNDMYDLIKAFKPQTTLYKDFCPMYNDKKGAIWISEVKDIKNPYLGKKMPTCGSVKEEIK